MKTPPIRILCVDDNDLVCQALERKFSGLPEFAWCGSLPDASGLVARAQEIRPDVVLLDLDMPGPDPVDAMASLLRLLPGCRVLVLSGLLTQKLIERVLAAGASGYLSKAASSAEILEAVERVAAGSMALGAEVRMVIRNSMEDSRR